jgi:hypothetical protein
LVILPLENHENIRALDGGCVHLHVKKTYIGNTFEENHGNIRALEGDHVHWDMKNAYIGNSF